MNKEKNKKIKVGELYVGGDAPITVQSMTNTVTQDIDNTVRQMLELEKNGCDIIRVAINTDEDAKAIKEIKNILKCP
jgi:4-hydroxy-3-methylbut-2-en-1-yl diphosphate synthase (EC 1.17.4.3)